MAIRDDTVERRRAIYRDALAVIERDYARDIEIDDVAHEVAASRRQLQRVFAQCGGTTFRDALFEARMRYARRILQGSDLAVKDVGRRVGYPQPAQFTKAFRHRHGMAPRQYRRQAREAGGDGTAGVRAAPNGTAPEGANGASAASNGASAGSNGASADSSDAQAA